MIGSRRPSPQTTATMGSRPDDLAAALRRETRIVRELHHALVRQRGAIAAASPEIINGTVDEIGRILFTLQQARNRRNQVLGDIGGMAPPSLERLDEAYEADTLRRVEPERSELRRAALEVAREAQINRTVIARAVESGEAFLQAIFSATSDPPAGYAAARKPHAADGAAILCNRRA
jgi:hypothetical protein